MKLRRKILFVSTYLSLITAAEKELTAAGYDVRCAHSASTTVQCLLAEQVDIVVVCGVLDWQQREAIFHFVKRRWETPVLLLSPNKPGSIQELLDALAAGGEHPKAA